MPNPNNDERCHFTYADGRRCRMPKLPTHPELCFDHWQRIEQAEDNHRAALEIVDEYNQLDTALGVNRALANVFRLTAQQRISAKYASSLAYIGHLLLCTLPHVDRESTKMNATIKPHIQRYLDDRENLSDDERKFWEEFSDKAVGAVKAGIAKHLNQVQHFDEEWKSSFKPRKRGRPRKHPLPEAPAANGSGEATVSESSRVA